MRIKKNSGRSLQSVLFQLQSHLTIWQRLRNGGKHFGYFQELSLNSLVVPRGVTSSHPLPALAGSDGVAGGDGVAGRDGLAGHDGLAASHGLAGRDGRTGFESNGEACIRFLRGGGTETATPVFIFDAGRNGTWNYIKKYFKRVSWT